MKKILGLDLGTNSIGWAVVNSEDVDGKEKLIGIEAAGSRIIPMDAAVLGKFSGGVSQSQTAERTKFRMARRLKERRLLRRERLHRVLGILGYLPPHYANDLDRYGHIMEGKEPKLAWCKNDKGENEFIFKESFNEMLEDFKKKAPEWIESDKKVPYDWTIYYLRKKALTTAIQKEELAWILLNFNQKRGYYQLRWEEEETPDQKVEYYKQKIVKVEDSGEKRGKDTWYNVYLENGLIYRRSSEMPLDWVGKTKEFIVTTKLEKDGTPKKDKDGNISRSFRAPKENDWMLIKAKTQADIEDSGKTVGAYIYDAILAYPTQKVRGKLVRTIERQYYKEELRQILEKQKEFHSELQDRNLYQECIEALYPSNETYRKSIANRDFTYLLQDDILFYQRDLKKKTSLIANCPYESHKVVDKTGEEQYYPVKCIAKSQPLFQEFRLWQFLQNLRIYRKDIHEDIDVTSEFLKTEEDYTGLFDWLNNKATIDQKALLKYPAFGLKKEIDSYRWNYVEDKSYPCNETRATVLSHLKKANIPSAFLTKDREEALWQILYSAKDRIELEKALATFASNQEGISVEDFVKSFKKYPLIEKEYGGYSAKAIKKLLPLMRMGKYWSETAIDKETRSRIDKIIYGEYDDNIKTRVREKTMNLSKISDFKGLPLWLACYIVYNRHSETKEIVRWTNPNDIDTYLSTFKQHTLRNPIVEQIILETLRTVRDIWKQTGQIDEIHVELGREMKNPSDKRKQISARVQKEEDTNLRIKALLQEFLNPEYEIENVRPYSPSQQEILRVYEDGVLNENKERPTEIDDILKKFKETDIKKRPSHNDVLKYKAWLEQKYRSPYTGKIIPLGRLFTSAYEIEHIIPKALYFDDSFQNKVICEAAVNKLKSDRLAHKFIAEEHGREVELGEGQTAKILELDAYEKHVRDCYGNRSKKGEHLLMDDIPDKFITRQLNDSRYISRVVKTLLSNIVREEGEEEATAKNVVVCTGGVTNRLKEDWGINDVWNRIIMPRFQRLDDLSKTIDAIKGYKFIAETENGHKIPTMPLELQKGFSKKRIDHRHHAMDAILIACASRNTINYLNNESACSNAKISRYDLQRLLCDKVREKDKDKYKWQLKKPWDTFTQDVYDVLNNVVISYKQNLRILNKASNTYVKFVEKDGKWKKGLKKQEGLNWAIRKPLHIDTVYGKVNLRFIKEVSLQEAIKMPYRIVEKDLKKKVIQLQKTGYDVERMKSYFNQEKEVWSDINLSKIKVYYFTKETKDKYYASRFGNDLVSVFTGITKADEAQDVIHKITDTGIQKILLRHLETKDNNPKLAFSPDGIDEMNCNIVQLNNGKNHKPIYTVRTYENASKKFPIGFKGNKSTKFVEADKGTNLYFAVYETKKQDIKTGEITTKRQFDTIPLNIAIDRLKRGLYPAPDNEAGMSPIFVLSPNDLVYVPNEKELKNGIDYKNLDKERIYKMISSSGSQCFFIKNTIATPIVDKCEFSVKNKMERALSGEMIKEICVPLKIDRLGNISAKMNNI